MSRIAAMNGPLRMAAFRQAISQLKLLQCARNGRSRTTRGVHGCPAEGDAGNFLNKLSILPIWVSASNGRTEVELAGPFNQEYSSTNTFLNQPELLFHFHLPAAAFHLKGELQCVANAQL
jgi:hypothetical protein